MSFLSALLVFLGIALVGAVAWFLVGSARGSSVPLPQGLEEPSSSLPPVLLPERPQPVDVDRLRFSQGFRGYRMDQVDETLERLRDRLAEQQREIRALRTERREHGGAEPVLARPTVPGPVVPGPVIPGSVVTEAGRDG